MATITAPGGTQWARSLGGSGEDAAQADAVRAAALIVQGRWEDGSAAFEAAWTARIDGWLAWLHPSEAALTHGDIDTWIKVTCAVTMAAGTAVGGWRIIRTLGHKMVRLQPVHGFAAETSAATIITIASSLGIPLSTTHNISAAIHNSDFIIRMGDNIGVLYDIKTYKRNIQHEDVDNMLVFRKEEF